MKKRQQLITGILISAMAFSTITKPEVVQYILQFLLRFSLCLP